VQPLVLADDAETDADIDAVYGAAQLWSAPTLLFLGSMLLLVASAAGCRLLALAQRARPSGKQSWIFGRFATRYRGLLGAAPEQPDGEIADRPETYVEAALGSTKTHEAVCVPNGAPADVCVVRPGVGTATEQSEDKPLSVDHSAGAPAPAEGELENVSAPPCNRSGDRATHSPVPAPTPAEPPSSVPDMAPSEHGRGREGDKVLAEAASEGGEASSGNGGVAPGRGDGYAKRVQAVLAQRAYSLDD
jgi:hypothetical protein